LLGIPTIETLEAWEFPAYKDWIPGNSHHKNIQGLGIPAIKVIEA
jgi:hypothetical protein